MKILFPSLTCNFISFWFLVIKFHFDFLSLEPDHARAKQNLRYYNDMIAEADEKKRIKGDTEDSDAAVKEEFKNDRPLDDYRGSNEFKTYEALCRGEQPKVRLLL